MLSFNSVMGGSWLATTTQKKGGKKKSALFSWWWRGMAERGWGFCDWHRSITLRGEANEAGYGLLKA